jgi:hypothetical protein
MDDGISHYGHKEDDGYPLAAWIWGHRLRVGQHWMEYLLEFLNVLAGFEYRLGQGLDGQTVEADYLTNYQLYTRLGLRRFVFYDEREKTRHPYDDRARDRLRQALRENVLYDPDDEGEALTLVRSLLRAFSAVEVQRSWFAKSLFPAHHNLLFWEALRKRATRYRGQPVPDGATPRMLDDGISFTDRNFFARGGEVYYLILSAGTETDLECRALVVERLNVLLNGHNQALGTLAEVIDQTWYDLQDDHRDEPRGTLGWIPDPACPLYVYIAEDVATFLQHDLDPLESLDLLVHLIGFHLTLYIYHRAHPEATSERHADGSCLGHCRPTLLVDALDGRGRNIIRSLSAMLFREQQYRQVQKGIAYVQEQMAVWKAELERDPNLAENLTARAETFFSVGRLHRRTRQPYERQRDHLVMQWTAGELDTDGFAEGYAAALTDLLLGDFRKNFLGVHRKLAKSVGFVAPYKGPSGRFVLEDNLLKALVLANLPPDDQMTFGDFLERLYERYGLIVGSGEARASGLFDQQRINAEYYDQNRAALLEKMKHAGLVIEYSDATALVRCQ